ncbi:MAG: restriction endonuclease subunit S [Nitrosomonas sp.]|uniref:restriction endonuclease subunit S n=1 Tax=Nitrosomonas sp. TaxID=42353 RepID=UPI002732993B|nr:restriction endonuclease subunit S [Nitrosomonas sp.]MDP3664684.1 restriction endonuclease subunit S [Nitrosomonas sp.]MDZ4107470.1 restriction endonuclease subunit S [Nitrosomonas sp.]
MSFPRYKSYKESGVEWLGDVPEHWVACRFSRVILAIKDGTHGTFSRMTEGKVFLSAKNVNNGRIEISDDESLITWKDHSDIVSNGFPQKGDLLLTIVGTIGRSCVYSLDEAIAFQRSVCFIRLKKSCLPQFFYFLTQSKFFQEQLQSRSKSSAQAGVYMGDVSATSIMFPTNYEEQQIIAAFLDRETAKIDALITEQQRLIELLKEKRQTVISHAVTKGLNPNAPMKDSGIEWLGEVPEHWEVCAIKRMTLLITDGAHISPETGGGVYDFISTKDISDKGIDFEGCLKTTSSSYEYLVRTGCQPICGDILFSKDGTIGRTVVIKEQRDFVVASSLIIIRPDSDILDSSYFNYLCQSSVVVQQVEGFVKGAGLPRLSIQNLLKVFGVFPSFVEQHSIVTFLDNETAKLDTLTTEAKTAITLLQERRTVLISAAVTGKIDVRGLVSVKPEVKAETVPC